MTEVEAAYLAGIIDEEGTITLTRMYYLRVTSKKQRAEYIIKQYNLEPLEMGNIMKFLIRLN